MRRKIAIAGLCLLALASIVCQKQQNIAEDKTAITRLVTDDNIWFAPNPGSDSTGDSSSIALTSDTLLVWWRRIQTQGPREINVEVVGDSAYVDWSRHNYGDLNLLIRVAPDTTWQLWVKPIAETHRVRGIFQRTGTVDDSVRGWKLISISLATGTSDSTSTVRIDSLLIQSSSNPDLIVRDPLNRFFAVDSLLHFHPSEEVITTIFTNTTDGDAFLHAFVLGPPRWTRNRLHYVGDGIFRRVWTTRTADMSRFSFFDLLNHHTLYAPPQDYGYDFNGWFLPYTIKNVP